MNKQLTNFVGAYAWHIYDNSIWSINKQKGGLLNAVFADFPFPIYSIAVNKLNCFGACASCVVKNSHFCINIHNYCIQRPF